MEKAEKFHLGDVLTVTTGTLLSLTHMDGVYKILNHMTGDNLFTHQIPRAIRECAPHLLLQFPQLGDLSVPNITPENHELWLASKAEAYGEWFDVLPLPKGAHRFIDPVSEAVTASDAHGRA